MLARLDDRSLVQTPRVKELKRGQLEDSLSFYREVVKDREAADPLVRLDVAQPTCRPVTIRRSSIGALKDARRLTEALAILERLVNEDPGRAEYRFALARTCRELGLPLAQAIPPRPRQQLLPGPRNS